MLGEGVKVYTSDEREHTYYMYVDEFDRRHIVHRMWRNTNKHKEQECL